MTPTSHPGSDRQRLTAVGETGNTPRRAVRDALAGIPGTIPGS